MFGIQNHDLIMINHMALVVACLLQRIHSLECALLSQLEVQFRKLFSRGDSLESVTWSLSVDAEILLLLGELINSRGFMADPAEWLSLQARGSSPTWLSLG